MVHFGTLIRTLRNRVRMSQADLAHAAGMSSSAIQNTERSDRNTLRWANFRKICEAFGVTEDEMDAMARGDTRTQPVKFPLKLLGELEPMAVKAGETVDDLVVRIVEQYLDQKKRVRPKGRVTKEPTAIVLPKVPHRIVRPSGAGGSGASFVAAAAK